MSKRQKWSITFALITGALASLQLANAPSATPGDSALNYAGAGVSALALFTLWSHL